MSMIKVENLTFSYPGSYDNVFENASFQIDTDWKLGFVGRGVLSDHVFSAGDMTGEAAVAKLMWVLGDPENRLHMLNENVCGEMS